MNTKKINILTKQLTLLCSEWTAAGIDEIGKDTALHILRELYSEIKFAGSFDLSEPTAQPQPVAQERTVDIIPEPVSEDLSGTTEVSASQEEPVLEQPVSAQPVPEQEEEPVVNEFRKKKLSKEKILSLYEDDIPSPKPVTRDEFTSEEQTAPVTVHAGVDTLAVVADLPDSVVVEQTNEEGGRIVTIPSDERQVLEQLRDNTVLGDILQGGTTLGDMYADTMTHGDISDMIGSGKIESLKSAIGINDKFQLIRDLFDGDAGRYEWVVEQLDSADTIEDAMLYLYENYPGWNPETPGVAMLVDLLTRKFS